MLPTVSLCLISTSLLLYVIRKYRESKWAKCTNNVKLDGKIAIVTGANSGIGYEIAKELASRNAQVILACRNMEKAAETVRKIKSKLTNNPNLVPMELDLASLASVKKFSDLFKANFHQLDLLINNAGVSYPNTKRIETRDKIEIHFAVNHLGHFYLTNLLLEHLSNKTHGRVVIITSLYHEKGRIVLDDLNGINSTNFYANSKLANVYFARELAKRTKEKHVNVYAVCPGWVYTGLFRHSIKWYHYFLVAPMAFFFMRTPEQGAQTAIYCATEPELAKETGLIYRDCTRFRSKTLFLEDVSVKLWEESEKMIEKNLR